MSHPPLVAESGAAQVALSLAAALSARGHEAVAWSPEPLPRARWWNRHRAQRAALDRFVEEAGPFEVVDAPAISISPRVARRAFTVARSVQPDLLYLGCEIRHQLRPGSSTSLPRALLHAAHGAALSAAVLGGFRRARVVLCLGSRELAWMRRRFPRWSPKLRSYVNAPPPDEQQAFAEIRARRRPPAPGAGARFLWIGRWTAHKGVGRLVAWLRERAASHPADSFTVAGCGPGAAADLPAELLAAGRVRVVPAFARAELPRLLADHDAGIFTSEIEGWGLSLNEMLESGMPVFATTAGGVEDLAQVVGPALAPFPPPDAPVLGGLSGIGLDRYLARFSWPAIAERYEREALAACAS